MFCFLGSYFVGFSKITDDFPHGFFAINFNPDKASHPIQLQLFKRNGFLAFAEFSMQCLKKGIQREWIGEEDFSVVKLLPLDGVILCGDALQSLSSIERGGVIRGCEFHSCQEWCWPVPRE